MSTIRRIGAVVLTTLVTSAFLAAVPAGAQQDETIVTAPEAFVASASGRGLNISLLGNNISIGASGALIDSTPRAEAQGAGVLLVEGTVANAAVSGANQADNPPKACVLNVPLLGLLTLTTACGEAAASTTNGLPQAIGAGSVATVDLGGTLLTPLLNQVGALLGQTVGDAVGTLDPLLGGLLNPLLGALNLDLTSLVDELFAGLQRATGVLSIRLGPSIAQATTTAEKVNGTALAQGATIEVLPGLSPLGAPLATIIVGDARATVDVTRPAASSGDPTTAVATPAFDAAIVRVLLGLPLLGNVTDIPVGIDQPLTLLAGTPLESTIVLGGGRVFDGPNGTKVAVADGVALELLKGLNGGIGIALAHAEAAAGGKSATVSIQQRQPPVIVEPELARTGMESAWLPMAGALMILAACGTRRFLRVRARH